jgi:hypothetical protein
VLRIVLELHHVDVAVRAQHQLALRAAPHAPDLLYRQNRHSIYRPSSGFACFLPAFYTLRGADLFARRLRPSFTVSVPMRGFGCMTLIVNMFHATQFTVHL